MPKMMPKIILTTLLFVLPLHLPAEVTPEPLDDADRSAIVALVKERLGELSKERDAQGKRTRRGTYSSDFRVEGDGRVLVSMIEDTVSGDSLATERTTLRFEKAGDGTWALAERTVDERYDRMTRPSIGDEDFYRFQAFELELEGLSLRAKNGTLFKDYHSGMLAGFVFTAEELEHDYTPPADTGLQHKFGAYLESSKRDFEYTADAVGVRCTPRECQDLLSLFTGLQSIDEGQAQPALLKRHEELLDARRDQREKNPFAGFAAPPDFGWHMLRLGVMREGAKDLVASLTGDLTYENYRDVLGKRRGVTLEVDGWNPEQVRVWAGKNYSPLFSYYDRRTRSAGISTGVLERRPDRNAREYELRAVEGTVELALVDRESMSADLRYELRAKRTIDHIDFSLARMRDQSPSRTRTAPLLLINSIQDGQGRELLWVRTGGSWGRVLLREPLKKGEVGQLRVHFENKGAIYDLNDSYSRLNRGGWLPFVRFGDMIHRFDLTVKVPAKYKALGVGTLVDSRREGGVSITRWSAKKPICFPTVIWGDYVIAESETVARRLDGSVVPVTMHFDKIGMMDWQVRPKQLQALVEQAASSLGFYTQLYQIDYPYGRLDLVNDPMGFIYGQAPSSIIYIGSGTFRGSGTLASIDGVADAGGLSRALNSLVAHEVAHQWWGSAIAMANMRNYWFIESLAEFSSALWVEKVHGRKAYLEQVAGWRHNVLTRTPASSVQDSTTQWSDGAYVSAIYNQGPYAFHMLREMVGDEKLLAFLRRLAQELEGSEATTADIIRVAESSLGSDIGWFFEQWIRSPGIPEYTFEHSSRQTEDGQYLVEGKIQQRVLVGRMKYEAKGVSFASPVQLTVRCKNGKTYGTRVLVKDAETPFKLKVPAKPVKVRLNENQAALAYDVKRAGF